MSATLTRNNLAAQLLVAMVSIDYTSCRNEDRAKYALKQADAFFKVIEEDNQRGSDHVV